MFSLNDCLWLSEDADIFEEQQSKKKTDYSDVYDLGDCMLCLNDCLCLLYYSNALNIHIQDIELQMKFNQIIQYIILYTINFVISMR